MTPGREVRQRGFFCIDTLYRQISSELSSFTGLDVFIAACARFTANPNSQA
jgi:hypothetical protein